MKMWRPARRPSACRSWPTRRATIIRSHPNGRGTATFTTAGRTYTFVFYLGPVGSNTTAVFQETDSGIASDGNFTLQQSASVHAGVHSGQLRDRDQRHFRSVLASQHGPNRRRWRGQQSRREIWTSTPGGDAGLGASRDGHLHCSRRDGPRHARAQFRHAKLRRVRRELPLRFIFWESNPRSSPPARFSGNSRKAYFPAKVVPQAERDLLSSFSTRATSSGTSTLTESCCVSATRIL